MLRLEESETNIDYEAIHQRQLDLVLRQMNTTGFFGTLVASVFVLLLYGVAPTVPLLVWFLIVVLYFASRWLFIFGPINRRIKQGRRRDIQLEYRLILFMWFVTGCLFGVGGYLFLPEIDHTFEFVGVIMILSGLVASNLQNFYWSSRLAGTLYVHPLMLGPMIRMLEYGYYEFFFQLLFFVVLMNTMIARMATQIAKSAMRDVHNTRHMRELLVEKAKAESANDEKTRFIAAANHDIRQPLNSMGMFLYSLRQQLKEDSAEKKAALQGVENSYKSLNELFSGLAQMATIDARDIEVNRHSISLDSLLEPLVMELDPVAKERGIALNYERSDQNVDTDPFLLARMCRNLIGNAIRYTPYGSVDISSEVVGSTLILNIADTGVGISAEQQSKIFEEYYQVQDQPREERKGLGLGLSIVKRISDLLDHRIQIHSVQGEGSTFSIELPLAEEFSLHEPKAVELNAFYGLRILVVDDEAEILTGMESLLSGWDCEVFCAQNPEQALEIAAQFRPDLVLCDYRLGAGANGVDLLKSLRSKLDLRIPCFIISGDLDYRVREASVMNGFDFMYKPIEPEILHSKISAAIE